MTATARKVDESMNEFLTECNELSERISSNLGAMEQGQYSVEIVDSMYRDIHTLKGAAYLFGVQGIGDIAHAMETALLPFRDRQMAPSQMLLSALSKCFDAIEHAAQGLERDGQMANSSEMKSVVEALMIASSEPPSPPHKESPPIVEDLSLAQVQSVAQEVTPAPMASTPAVEASTPGKSPVVSDGGSDSSSTVRVPVALLDKLMTLMGEMVLVRNQVLQYSSQSDDLEFLNLSQRLDIVTSELQGEVMKTRMQPIGNILTKFQRVVRDLGRDLNKKIELNLTGQETELDKTLLEAIKDPLTHLVRNSCDHGIEAPADRLAAGKPETGRIEIRAFHEGGQVIVEITDDGRGLNREKLINKALEKGIITQDRAPTMSEREVFNLIFAPGFSTAAQVTNVSGRGVGMDVVRSNIEKIGGRVDLDSELGKGTVIRLKIPLTLAIVPAMIVRCGHDLYAIPQVKLVELVRVERNGSDPIEYLQGKPVYRLRGDILPLIDLREVLGLHQNDKASEVANLVVLQGERQMFGLIVDEIKDTADIVVKALSRFLKSLPVYSGATVLGDGSVALILDVMGIANRMRLAGETQKSDDAFASANNAATSEEAQEFLLFRVNSPTKHAVPLSLVHRLEEFRASAIEYSGGQRVVRYRDTVLPLVSLNDHLNYPAQASGDIISVLVFSRRDKLYGLEVTEILDVLSTTLRFDDLVAERKEILGNLITSDEVIVVVDALKVIDRAGEKWTGGGGKVLRLQGPKPRVLYVEDTGFFRKHVANILEKGGYEVTMAVNGQEALDLVNTPEAQFDLILSDIEMPKMNGLQFARELRKISRWKSTPLIALTTRFNDAHVEEGLRAGFDHYTEKLNEDSLSSLLSRVVTQKKERAHA